VIIAFWVVVTVLVLAVKLAVVALARTETEDGIEKTLAIAPERDTEVAESTVLFRVTVQEVLAFETSEEAAHCTDETLGSVTSEIDAVLEEPLREAVTAAV
jgi:hypothetical protein